MRRDIIGRAQIGRAQAIPAASMIALALGAAAFGAIAVGALAIGRLALGRVTVKRARFEALEVDELTVRKLRVREYEGPPPRARQILKTGMVANFLKPPKSESGRMNTWWPWVRGFVLDRRAQRFNDARTEARSDEANASKPHRTRGELPEVVARPLCDAGGYHPSLATGGWLTRFATQGE